MRKTYKQNFFHFEDEIIYICNLAWITKSKLTNIEHFNFIFSPTVGVMYNNVFAHEVFFSTIDSFCSKTDRVTKILPPGTRPKIFGTNSKF